MEKYLYKWIEQNYESICTSEWYDDNFDGEIMDDIETGWFIDTYLVQLIESNILYDFGVQIDAREILGGGEDGTGND